MRQVSPALAPDAAIAVGLASTAMPFARTPEAALERWLRILRLYGDAGAALQSLGVGEDRVQEPGSHAAGQVSAAQAAGAPEHAAGAGGDGIDRVCERAWEIAHRHGGGGLITTGHLLLAVMSLYGAEFDRVLQAHGCDREDLAQRLGAGAAAAKGLAA